jgi:hypothetical protein
MRQRTRTSVACFAILLMVAAVQAHADESSIREHDKIEALIQHVERLSDAVFIRNNKTYSSRIAAQFLRDKWDATLDKVTTARDFIEKIASVSSTSGQPYRIRFTDGREMHSGPYLHAVLQQLEK